MSPNDTATRGLMTPVLIDHGSLLRNPTSAQALLLRLTWDIHHVVGGPVEREVLEWWADQATDLTLDHDGALRSLRAALGPRPRRHQMFVALGDLLDAGLLEQTPGGFVVTDRGDRAVGDLEASGLNFKALVSSAT